MSFSIQGEGDQSAHYSITLNALCAEEEWGKVNGMCPPETTATPTPVEPTPITGPAASLTISPAGTLIYPTLVTYKLSSTGAQSCSIVDYMGNTYVSPTDNLTNKTITSITTPQTAVFSTKCWSGPNGTGTVSATKTSTVIVKCPTNTAWNGTVCK